MAGSPIRLTVSLGSDEETLLRRQSKEANVSTSELVRRAVRFYGEYKNISQGKMNRRMRTYLDMLPSGEHLIIDVEHWILFMKLIEKLPDSHEFWDSCTQIAKDHAEQFRGKITSVESLLERLEDCNFFRVQKDLENGFTLILGSKVSRRFVQFVTGQLLQAIGYRAELKPSMRKIRLRMIP